MTCTHHTGLCLCAIAACDARAYDLPGSFQDPTFEMLWQHRSSGEVHGWTMDERGVAQDSHVIASPNPQADWRLIGQGDHDRNGQSDYLWRNQVTGQNQLQLNSTQVIELFTVNDPNWQIESWVDLDDNGSLDLLWRHQSLGYNNVWLMQAGEIVQGLTLPTVADMQWAIGGVGDFNQDGQGDIFWRHKTSGANGIWHLRQGVFQDGLFIEARPDANWQVSAVADLDGDRQGDIIWHNGTTGQNQAWLMQGQQRQVELALPSVADQSWQLVGIAQPNADLPAPIPIRTADLVNPTLTNPNLLFPTKGSVDIVAGSLQLSESQVGLNQSPPIINAQLQWPENPLPQGLERLKVSWYLSSDATISRTDRFLGAQSLASSALISPLPLQQSLTLPDATDPFWQRIWAANNSTAYVGILVEPIGATDINLLNNQRSIAITVERPELYEYDFTYAYDAAVTSTQNADQYRGQVIAHANTYKLSQIIDPNPAENQSNQNGQYTITGLRPYKGLKQAGTVLVTEYADAETATRYQPIPGDAIAGAHGSNYLGSESGYIQARRSNTDRFGHDFYEADVWLTPPANPGVTNAERSTNLVIRSLVNPFLSHWDTSNNGGIITYSFYRATETSYAGRERVSEVNEAVKRNVREILGQLETQINVRFVEVEETDEQAGAVRYMVSDGDGQSFYAYTYYPSNGIGGDVHLSAIPANDIEDGFGGEIGSYGYRSLLHETLHALGLKHPGNYDAVIGGGVPPFLLPEDDNSTNSIMSYNITGFYPITPMDYDLRALQYLYGAQDKATGRTNYKFSSLTRYQVGPESFGAATQLTKQVIFDRSGLDTADFSQLSVVTNHWFDLRPGGIFTALSAYDTKPYQNLATGSRHVTSDYGTAIASNTVIENIINSRGNDQIIANDAANEFLGYRLGVNTGNDVIHLADSADRLVLQDYQIADLQVKQDQMDLVLNLAGNGTVRLKDYFQSETAIVIQVANLVYRYDNKLGWQPLIDRAIAV